MGKRKSLQASTSCAVHTSVVRLQIYPLWGAFSKIYVYRDRSRRLRVDGRPKRAKIMRLRTQTYTCGRAYRKKLY